MKLKLHLLLFNFLVFCGLSGFSQVVPGDGYMNNDEREIGHAMLRQYRKSMKLNAPTDTLLLKRALDSLQHKPINYPQPLSFVNPAVPMGTAENYAAGKVKGFWRFNETTDSEGKTGLYGHRTDFVQYNPTKNRVYVLSSVRNLLVGDLTDNGKLSMSNQTVRIEANIFLCMTQANGNSRIIGGIGEQWNDQALCYSDDEGQTWEKSVGGDFQNGQAIWGAVLNNSEKTVLAITGKYVNNNGWKNTFILSKSTDKGATYTPIQSWDETNTDRVTGCNPHNTNDCYIVRKVKGSSTVETYKYTASNGTFALINTTQMADAEMRTLVGSRQNSTDHLYLNLVDRGYHFNGSNWQFVSQQAGWNNLINVHPTDYKHIYLHDYDSKFSLDGGVTVQATDWWEPAFGWDPKDTKWFKKSNGTWFMAHCNDFGAHFAENPDDKTSWKHLNISGVHQILHHGDYNDKTGFLLTGNQDRGSMGWSETSPGVLSGFTAAKADGLRECIANTGNSYWFIHYWGVLYHRLSPHANDDRGAEIKITDVDWYTPAMAASTKPNEDAVYVGGFDNLKKYTYNKSTNQITETVFPFNFAQNAGKRLYGVATCESDPNRIYVCTENGAFYYSTNGGTSFTRTTYNGAFPPVSGWPYWGPCGYAIAVSDQNPDIVYLSGDGNASNAFLISKDGGKTFTVATNGMTKFRNQELVVSADGKFVFGTNQMVFDVVGNTWYDLATGSCPNDEGLSGVDLVPSRNMVRYYSWGVGVLDLVLNGKYAAPVVKILSPKHNSLAGNGTLTVAVDAVDGNGTIAKVDLYKNGTKVATLTAAPYNFVLTNVTVGDYWFYAIATDNDGLVGRSAENSVQIMNIAPARDPDVVTCTSPGLEYKYFEGSWTAMPNYSAMTPLRSGVISNFDISIAGSVTDYYGIQYSGYIEIKEEGIYTFRTSSDDGSMLYIGNTLVVNNDGPHGDGTTVTGSINLKKGFHSIRVDYFELYGGEALNVSWYGPSFSAQPISNSLLYYSNSSGCADCNGTAGGSAFTDRCNKCVGGTTGKSPCPLTYWEFTSSTEDWWMANNISGASTNGILNVSVLAGDPYMYSPDSLFVPASTSKYVVVRMQNLSSDNKAQLFWATTKNKAFDGTKSITFTTIPNDTIQRYYIIDLNAKASWTDTIHQIRIDPVAAVSTGNVKIDFIKITGAYPSVISAIPGTIEVENFNVGGQGNAYNDVDAVNNGNKYRLDESVDVETCAEGGFNVGWTAQSEWMDYIVDVQKTANYVITLRFAAPAAGAKLHLEIDGKIIDKAITLSSTTGFQTYDDATIIAPLQIGKHVLKLVSESNGYNINAITFTEDLSTLIPTIEQLSDVKFSIYPNPAAAQFTIYYPSKLKSKEANITNTLGQVEMTFTLNTNNYTSVDISTLSAGIYFVKVDNHTERLVVEK
ncbi:MAG: PA14 domain-containing protein [Bacteroidetes bacterium]|nr:PA14 domain-containing protein [Bacteroidota bacterium]